MKYLAHLIAVIGIMFLTSGCSTSSDAKLASLNAGTCDNPKCQCGEKCECGENCKCGMNGNSTKMNGK